MGMVLKGNWTGKPCVRGRTAKRDGCIPRNQLPKKPKEPKDSKKPKTPKEPKKPATAKKPPKQKPATDKKPPQKKPPTATKPTKPATTQQPKKPKAPKAGKKIVTQDPVAALAELAGPATKPVPGKPTSPTGNEKIRQRREVLRAELPNKRQVSKKRVGKGSLNAVYKVSLQDGTEAYYKPQKGESNPDPDSWREGTQAMREVATSAVAVVLGCDDLVPVTVWNHDDTGEKDGSLQEAVNGVTALESMRKEKVGDSNDLLKKKIDKGTRLRVSLFDFLIGNKDRHPDNWMWDRENGDKYGNIALIDNGLTFPDHEGSMFWTWGNGWMENSMDEPIPDYVGDWYEKRKHIADSLKEHGLSKGAINGAMRRLEAMEKVRKNGGTFGEISYTADNGRDMNLGRRLGRF